VPWLTATHRLPNKTSAPYWSKIKLKKWVRLQHSPSLIGESDYGWKDVGFCLATWAFLGQSHKLPKEMVGQEIVLHKQKRDIREYLKPDSPLVLLFWARQIIAWHYIRYWLPLEKEHETGREKDKQHQTGCQTLGGA
jgi:hypothetical protein